MDVVKRNILLVATDLFRMYSFKSVTVDDISQKAGISKKTLYENFKDKDELVFESVVFMSDMMVQEDQALLVDSKNAIEDFIIYMNNFEKNLKGLNRNCVIDLQRFYNSAFLNFLKHKDYIYACLVKSFKKGIKEKLFRKNINIHNLAKYRVESVFYMVHNMFQMDENVDVIQMQLDIMELYLYGISTIEGHQKIEEYFNKRKKLKSF